MLLRVVIAATILQWSVAIAFIPYAATGLAAGALALTAMAWPRRQSPSTSDHEPDEGSPLQVRAALQMAGFFQIVMILIGAVTAWWSLRALLVTAAIVGLTDLDALTLSLSRQATALDPQLAARALAVGVVSNTRLKLSVAMALGANLYRWRVSAALATIAISIGVVLWWCR